MDLKNELNLKYIDYKNRLIFSLWCIFFVTRALLNILLGTSAIGNIVMTITSVIGLSLSGIGIFLYKKPITSKYLTTITMSIVTVSMVESDPGLRTLLIFYLYLVFLTSYLDKKIEVFITSFTILYFSYCYFTHPGILGQGTTFEDLLIHILYIGGIGLIGFLIIQINEKLLDEVYIAQKEAIKEKDNNSIILEEISNSAKTLNPVKDVLFNAIKSTTENSQNLLLKTENFNTTLQLQKKSVMQVVDSVKESNTAVIDTLETIKDIRLYISNTLQKSKNSLETLEKIKEEMNSIVNQINTVNINNKTLLTHSDNIKNHLMQIKKITRQSTVLSLNAGIESTKTNSYSSSSFAIIAKEMRILSDEVSKFTLIIDKLIRDKEVLEEKVNKAILIEQNLIESSSLTINDISSELNNINQGITKVNTKSIDIEKLMSMLTNQFGTILTEVDSMNIANDSNITSLEDILFSNSKQLGISRNLQNSYNDMDIILEKLNELLGKNSKVKNDSKIDIE